LRAREFVEEADKASMRIYEHLQVSLTASVASGGLGVLFYNSNLNTVHL
jgi:hypothetical protein